MPIWFFCHLPHDNMHHLTPLTSKDMTCCSCFRCLQFDLSAALKPGKKKKKVQSFLICSLTADSVLDPAAPDWKMDLFSLLRPVKSLILSLDVRSFKGHKEVAGTAVIEWGKAEKWLTLHCCCSPCSRASYTLLFRCEWFEFTMRY